MPPKGKKGKKPKINYSQDLSGYLAALVDGAEQVSGSTDGSGSSGSSYSSYDGRPGAAGVVIPETGSSPRVRMVEEFMRGTAESGDWMRKWYSENYEKVKNYDYLRFELLYFLSDKMPGIRVDENIAPLNLVELVKELVLDLQTKVNKFNLELGEVSGHEIAGQIKDHHRKVLEVVKDYENQLKSTNEELAQCKDQIVHLDAELTAALQKLMYYEGGAANYDGYVEDSVTEEQFMADLQSRAAHSEALHSSLKKELQREKEQSEGLKSQLAHLAKEKVEIEEKCMQEIVELSKRAEINSMLEHGIEQMLEGGAKEPNTEDCQNLIDQWKTEINQVIDQNSKEIDELLKKVESQNNELMTLQAQASEQDENLEKMQRKAQNKQRLFDKYKAQATDLQAHVTEVKKIIEELHHESYGLQSFWGRGGAQPAEEDLEAYNIDDRLTGVLDYDVLGETQPIRWGRRQRRRREVIYPPSESPEEDSSTAMGSSDEEQQMPMERMGVMRFEEESGTRSPTQPDEIDVPRGPLRFVDGQWIGMEEAAPQPVPQQLPPSGAGLMGPVRLDQAGWASVGGRQSPIEQAQAGGAMRFVGGQWVPADPRPPQSPLPTPLQSTWRDRSLGQSRIPTREGAASPGFDVSSIQPASPRARTPTRLQRSGTPTRLQVPGMGPTTPRSGTPTRLQVPGMGPTTPRSGTPSRLQVPGMGPTTPRSGTPSRLQVPGTQPAMPPTGLAVPDLRLTTPRAGTSQRLGASGMGPATTPRARAAPRVGTSGMRPAATRPGTPPRPRIPTQRPAAQRSAIPSVQPAAPRVRVPQRSTIASARPTAQRSRFPQRQGAPSMQPPAATPADPLMSRVMLLSPMRQEPLTLDVDVEPQSITPTGEEFVCEVAVGVHPVPPESGARNAPRNQRGRRPRPHFTPRTGFQR